MGGEGCNMDDFDIDSELSKFFSEQESKKKSEKLDFDDSEMQVCRTIIIFPISSVEFVKKSLHSLGVDVQPVLTKNNIVIVFLEDDVKVNPLDTLMNVNERPIPESHLDVVLKASEIPDKYGVVAMTGWFQKVMVEDSDIGQVVTKRYVHSKMDEILPPSIILAMFSEDIEQLLLGVVGFEKFLKSSKSSWIKYFKNKNNEE